MASIKVDFKTIIMYMFHTHLKAAIHKAEIEESKALIVKLLDDPFFDPNWHFHSEYQLFLVLEGDGTRFIGDNIKRFSKGDMVFTGPNMPHLWRNDEVYFNRQNDLGVRGIVIYFPQSLLGDCLHKEEFILIKHLFERSQRGLEIFGETNKKIAGSMHDLLKMNGLEAVIQLFKILSILAHSQDYGYIASMGYVNTSTEVDKDRMSSVYNYIMKHYKYDISMKEVAEIANLSPSSFSRYFKTRTNKTFTAFISELRIGYACKLLLDDKYSITQTCYECGYNTLSNFNRQFKEIVKKKPLDYKREYLKVI